MPEEDDGIGQRIRTAVLHRDASALEKIVGEIASFCFKEQRPDEEPFPEALFSLLLTLMETEEFLDMKGSSHLLILFEYDWCRLNEAQKHRLLEAFSRAYEKFRDWMACFVITELLGEYYCDKNSLQALCELQKTSNVVARSLVPHGFEHIIKATESPSLRDQAMSRLLSMKNDTSDKVRDEVEAALNNLP